MNEYLLDFLNYNLVKFFKQQKYNSKVNVNQRFTELSKGSGSGLSPVECGREHWSRVPGTSQPEACKTMEAGTKAQNQDAGISFNKPTRKAWH